MKKTSFIYGTIRGGEENEKSELINMLFEENAIKVGHRNNNTSVIRSQKYF